MSLVVGVIFPPKKIARLQEVLTVDRDDIRFILIDLEDLTPTKRLISNLELEAATERFAAQYGLLDALLHKLSHEMVFEGMGDFGAVNRVKLVQNYLQHHPSVCVVDPFDSVRLLTDRHAACKLLQSMEHSETPATQRFKVPKFFEANCPEQFQTLLKDLNTGRTFLAAKANLFSAATERSHMMSVITKLDDLQYDGYPTLYQEFINHSGRLFKGYVLGNAIDVAERRSLPNLVAGTAQHVRFNTQQNYPTSEDFHPHVDLKILESRLDDKYSQQNVFAAVRAIGKRLREELNLTLFGFDVILADDGSCDLYVIDINYFPSYRELADFSTILRTHIKQLCGRQ
ncbi:hypothetical protein CCR75_008386 [Bremia lactucae]|uniref:Inositol-tetrakisphosphate 1-kinase n=1 Tax=Bremia lactucae TaxID=4779 RepID=A0A976IJN3_BRELC|nr:hypothetical protein CCR75_008386 [Bremia lactucae]